MSLYVIAISLYETNISLNVIVFPPCLKEMLVVSSASPAQRIQQKAKEIRDILHCIICLHLLPLFDIPPLHPLHKVSGFSDGRVAGHGRPRAGLVTCAS